MTTPARKTIEDSARKLSESIEAEAQPPDGFPRCLPLLQLPRRDRAKVLQLAGVVVGAQAWLGSVGTTTGTAAILAQAARVQELAADMEDLLVLQAADGDVMRDWLASCTDMELFNGVGYALGVMNAGEANSSSS